MSNGAKRLNNEQSKHGFFSGKIKLAISLSVTLIFIWAVEYLIGWSEILKAWSALPLSSLLLALLFLMTSYALRAMRIFSYFQFKGLVEFGLCLKMTLMHNFYNNMLPMRSGELSFPIYLYRYFNIGKVDSVVTLFYFRLLDLHVLLTLLLCISFFLFPQYLLGVAITLITWVALSVYIVHSHTRLLQTLQGENLSKWKAILVRILQSFPDTKTLLINSYFWTLLNWVIKLVVFAWILMQFSSLDFNFAAIGVIFGDATSVLPIHGVAGAGTYEAGVLFGVGLFGVKPQEILTAAVNLHLFILGGSILGVVFSKFIAEKRSGD